MDLRPAGPVVTRRTRLDVPLQLSPQCRLPKLLGRQCLLLAATDDNHVPALLPPVEPVRPIHLVLVKQIGNPLRQLEAPAVGLCPIHEAAQGRKQRVSAQFRQ